MESNKFGVFTLFKQKKSLIFFISLLLGFLSLNPASANEINCKVCLSAHIERVGSESFIAWRLNNCGDKEFSFMEAELPWMGPPLGAALSAKTRGGSNNHLTATYDFSDNRNAIVLGPNKTLEGKTELNSKFPKLNSEVKKGISVVINWRWSTKSFCQGHQNHFRGTLLIAP